MPIDIPGYMRSCGYVPYEYDEWDKTHKVKFIDDKTGEVLFVMDHPETERKANEHRNAWLREEDRKSEKIYRDFLAGKYNRSWGQRIKEFFLGV